MTLTIYHDDNGGNCTTTKVGTNILITGGSGAAPAKGLWVISEDYAPGSGDKTINLDSVHIDLGNTALSKEDIADKIVTKVTDGSWVGKQYKDLPYTATKLDGSSSTNDDCPNATTFVSSSIVCSKERKGIMESPSEIGITEELLFR